MLDQADLAAGRINLLAHRTDATPTVITTVSPTYAREIQTAEYGMGLETLLRKRADAVVGILNGVDYDEWDPRRDRYLPQHYGANQLGVKAELKQQFLQRLKLDGGPRTALIGIVSRLATQKGFDLLFECAAARCCRRASSIWWCSAPASRATRSSSPNCSSAFPTRVHFQRGYSDELAHWIEAASDMFLMPSRYEPCGLNQMYSLRYGTVPIVRRTGGLADSVQHFDAATGARHRHRVQRLQRARRSAGRSTPRWICTRTGDVAPAGAERHGAGFLLESAGARATSSCTSVWCSPEECRSDACCRRDSQPHPAFLVERNVAHHAALQVHLPIDAIVHRVVAEAADQRRQRRIELAVTFRSKSASPRAGKRERAHRSCPAQMPCPRAPGCIRCRGSQSRDRSG